MRKILRNHPNAALYVCLVAALLVPNIALCFTEHYSLLADAINIVLPAGVYMLLCSMSPRLGRTVWLCFPLMFLAAFQVVLLDLFGNSIIAVDMFLNLVTTNASEVCELLSDMFPVIAAVVVIYVPLLVWACVYMRRRRRWQSVSRWHCRRVSYYVISVGAILLCACYASGRYSAVEDGTRYETSRELFPLNVICNIGEACQRYTQSHNYKATCADFSYQIQATEPPDSAAPLVILVIGETSRAPQWQLAGYARPTNPRLSRRQGLVFFPHAMSESNTTHKSVPMLLTSVHAQNFDSIYSRKGVISAFSEGGYRTLFLSNQSRNHSLIDYLGEEADRAVFIKDTVAPTSNAYDMALIPLLREAVEAGREGAAPLLAVLHTYGSHFKYNDRYPAQYRVFIPDAPLLTGRSNRDRLVNAYDNTIVYTDALLDSIISVAAATGRPAAVVYTSDHGEDLYDDGTSRFLHASPRPSPYQLAVPFLVWTSDSYADAHPVQVKALEANRQRPVSSTRALFNTLLDLARFRSPYFEETQSVASERYTPVPPLYLNDHNHAIPASLSY